VFFVQMEAGLMEIVRSLNRSWIYDTYFSLYRAIHPEKAQRKKCPEEMSGYPKPTIVDWLEIVCWSSKAFTHAYM